MGTNRIRLGPTKPGFRPYRDKAGKWRWRLFAANGLVVATSNESFASRSNCLRAVRDVTALVVSVSGAPLWNGKN